MKLRLLLFTLCVVLIPAICLGAAKKKKSASSADDRSLHAVAKVSGDSRQRIALVIGNSSYALSPLKNPANDARVMAATLRRLGFEVDEKTNLGFVAMNEAVERFGSRLRNGGVGLFYYAGHGMQVNGNNYLVPVDAHINAESEVRYKSIDAGLVLAKMEQARSDVNIVVLDACRDNPFARSFRSGSRGLAFMDAPSGTFIAYATAPGKTAADGSGSNGLYTSELVKVLETPGVTLEKVFKMTNKAVLARSNRQQSPWTASNLVGDFWFVPHDNFFTTGQITQKAVATSLQPAISVNMESALPIDIELINVPGGCFQMGDLFGDGLADETPVHEVCLSDFRIAKYEVTQGLWERVMGNNPSVFKTCGENCPVDNVTWEDAQKFITKFNKLTGNKYRLPTEVEWEYACRGAGSKQKFCGGDNPNILAWYSGNSAGKTHPVGQKQPNGLGIFDMSGNVWEWVSDWYDRSSTFADNISG